MDTRPAITDQRRERLRVDGFDLGALIAPMTPVPHYGARVELRVDGALITAGAEVPATARVVVFEPLPWLKRLRIDDEGAWWSGEWLTEARARLQRLEQPRPELGPLGPMHELVVRGAACPPTPTICNSCRCVRRAPANPQARVEGR